LTGFFWLSGSHNSLPTSRGVGIGEPETVAVSRCAHGRAVFENTVERRRKKGYVVAVVMENFQLSLRRAAIGHFKSIRRAELNGLNNLALLMGRNNAGKSNCLDAFKFLAEASVDFNAAVNSRGSGLADLFHRKRTENSMEFVLEFVPTPKKRIELINRLFTGNPQLTPGDVINSNFFSALTLKVTITAGGFSEELSIPNVSGERGFVLYSIQGTPEILEAASGQLEALCKRCGGELPSEPVALEIKPESLRPYRLRLGCPDSPGAFPVSAELASAVRNQIATLEWIDPLRRMPASSPILGKHVLTEDVSNLPDVLHWLYNNKPKQFRRIESEVARLVPNLGKLYTPTEENHATLGIIDGLDEDLVYSMNQMSFGTRSIVAIIAKVTLAAPGSWVCIEEPETYLHPRAQVELFHFLREEARTKRIFVATHSTSIAASCPLSSLFIVRRDEENCTSIEPVTPATAFDVIEQLGVKPSFSFEAGAIVFVESSDQMPIFEAWAKNFECGVKVQFLDAEGGCTLHYLANARIAMSHFVHTMVFAVFGNGSEISSQSKKIIVEQLELPPDQVIITDFPELEGYLMDASAIQRAFPSITLLPSELEARLDPARTLHDQKKALGELLMLFRIGEYNGHLGARIAEAMEDIPGCVRQLFELIAAGAKPYWKI
jgi:predicted ATPase